MSDDLPRILTNPRVISPDDGITIRRATRSGFMVDVMDGGHRETVACSNLADLLEWLRGELADHSPPQKSGFFRRGQ